MATRYGHVLYQWLLVRGWQPGPPLPPGVRGDRPVIDPHNQEQVDVYTAARRQQQRTGEHPPHGDAQD